MNPNVIRPSQIQKAAGISKSTAYRLLQQGKFPKPIRLTDKAIGWRAADIDKWLAERAKAKPKTRNKAAA